MNCVLFAKMDQVFSKENKTLKKYWKIGEKYWKSQGILSVRKSGNPECECLSVLLIFMRNYEKKTVLPRVRGKSGFFLPVVNYVKC